MSKNREFLQDKTVLVTGGTGTFGRALVTRLLGFPEVRKVIVYSRDEFKQSELQKEITDPRIRFFIGDVRDLPRLDRAFRGVDIVVHAAALKQVPAIEYNPTEAIKTNIYGTQNVIDAALNNTVENVLLISSDKAVQPINLYGATKLCAEKLFVAANSYRGFAGKPKFSVVRYGNVLGSRGSLLEVIAKQRHTGVVTLTDERMTRFWITIDSIMPIVFNIFETMRGGEIFVPKMKSLKVTDVLYTVAADCKINVTGIRPGEKIHETLITEYEAARTKDGGNKFIVLPEFVTWEDPAAYAASFSGHAPFPQGSMYVSNHPDYLLSQHEAEKIISPSLI